MKKVLILSYFFTPCNLTASQRTLGWVKYLSKFGYYPIVVTRNWEVPINKPSDVSIPSGDNIVHKVEEGYEVYYLPYKGNLRDRIYAEHGERYAIFRRMLSLVELIGQYISNWFIPFSNMYDFADKVISRNDFKALIISANPFIQFRFGYLLNKKHKLPWIADYRDDWSTDELSERKSGIDRLLHYLGSKAEKKWVGTATFVSSVSPYYIQKISDFTGVKGETIYNGFFEEDFKKQNTEKLFNEITFTFNGTLYPSQSVEIFLEGFKQAVDENADSEKTLRLYFPGLAFKPDQVERIKSLMLGYEENYIITPRMPREEVISIQKKSHVLLMFPHKGIKGIPSSKLYEYLGLRMPILLCPSDDDIIEETIKDTHSGFILKSSIEVKKFVLACSSNYEKLISKINFKNADKYTRESQAGKLASMLDKL